MSQIISNFAIQEPKIDYVENIKFYFLAAILGIALGFGIINFSYDYQKALIIAGVLTVFFLLIVRNHKYFELLLSAWVLRLLIVLGISLIVEGYYGQKTGLDAFAYHKVGTEVAVHIWRYFEIPKVSMAFGTINYAYLTGFVYLLFGPTFHGMKVLNSIIGLVGALFFYKAFTYWYKEKKLLLILLLFLPSIMYWSSIHGKDPLVFFLLGLSILRAVIALKKPTPLNIIFLFIPMIGVYYIRPVTAALVVVSIAFAFIVRPFRYGLLGPIFKTSVVTVVLISTVWFIQQAQSFLGISSVSEILFTGTRILKGLSYGGSAIPVPNITSWHGFLRFLPVATFAVLFRPFPWEANNPFALMVAIESLFVMLLAVRKLFNLRKIRVLMLRFGKDPFLVLIICFITLFLFAHSFTVANLGTMVRIRIQILPFLFMLFFIEDAENKMEI